ncbi:MAG: hypothetical protein A2Y63_04785 [Candidatus Riflebacteria bacterium RBG_13_59_9]|nr:MAG: hypothetical protein A2Y63_04785 [Candidatus Riflebacteria bacterium RBG_13_59_9]
MTRFAWLLGAIVVLLIFLFYTNMQKKEVERRHEEPLAPFLEAAQIENCNYIVIAQGEERKVELVRADGKWRVQMPEALFPASPDDVKDFIEYFDGLRPESVVDRSEETFSDYGVDEEHAVAVKFFRQREDETPVLHLLMGNRGSDYRSVFTRKAGDNTTYLLGENQSTLWEQEADLWRDKYPLRESRDDFNAITVRSPAGAFTVVKGDEGFWEFTDDKVNKVNQELTVSLISRLTGLVGLSLRDEDHPEFKLNQPEFEFELGIGERVVTLAVSAEVEDKRYLRNSELNQIYALSAPAFEGILTERKEYIQPEEEAEEAGENANKTEDSAGSTAE